MAHAATKAPSGAAARTQRKGDSAIVEKDAAHRFPSSVNGAHALQALAEEAVSDWTTADADRWTLRRSLALTAIASLFLWSLISAILL